MAKPIHIPVLYEDNHLLVAVKPPGILSQEDHTGDPDMLTLLKQDLKIRHNKPGNVFLGLVHRLDRSVGGVMIFGKTSKAAARLSESIRSRQFDKGYMCVVQGRPAKHYDKLTHYILKDNKRNQVSVYNEPKPEAKHAVLEYKDIATSGQYSLVAVQLHTGRPHQIRAQLSHIGCPLAGDLKYGAKPIANVNHIALWSTFVACSHPTTKEWMSFVSLPHNEEAWAWWSKQQLERASIGMSEVNHS